MDAGEMSENDDGVTVRSAASDLDYQNQTRHVGVETAIAGGFVGVGAALILLAGSIRPGSIPDPITSAGMPRLAGILLVAFGGVMFVRFLSHWLRHPDSPRVPSEGDNDEPGHPSSFLRPLSAAIAGVLWTWSVSRIGYFLATPLLILAVLRVMDVRSRGKLISVPIGFTAIIWILFAQVLGIGFPLGFMDTPLREIGFIR